MSRQLTPGDKAPNFHFDTPWTRGGDFYAATAGQSAVLVFLRYHGCPVCQMEMAALRREMEMFREKEARVFVFLQSAAGTLSPLLDPEDWPLTIVCDPDGAIFRQYRVEPGGILRYLHPAGLISAIKATAQGYFHKKFEGKETQLPGAFVARPDKTIAFAHYGRHISDVPRPSVLARYL